MLVSANVLKVAFRIYGSCCIVYAFVALLQLEGGGTLLASVQALGCSCAIEKQVVPRSVSWMRRHVCAQVRALLPLGVGLFQVDCGHIVVKA